LSSFGKDSHYPAALQLSDEDMVRLWLLASGLLLKERARSSGKATALAAVAVIEGNQRPSLANGAGRKLTASVSSRRRKNGMPRSPESRRARASMKGGVDTTREIQRRN
jgi:hypothetical protein